MVYSLLEIKINNLGEKTTCIIDCDGYEREFDISTIPSEFIQQGKLKHAIIENNEIFYKPSNKLRIDLTNAQINEWTVIEPLSKKRWKCRCSCGKYMSVRADALKAFRTRNCGHNLTKNDLTGKKINSWTFLRYVGNNYYECQCSCGKIKKVKASTIVNGTSMSCGHDTSGFKDLTNSYIGEWHVLRYMGNSNYECQCSCGNIKIIDAGHLRSGQSKSCGHQDKNFIDLTGQVIFDWTVLGYDGHREGRTRFKCLCKCGRTRLINSKALRSGQTKSCGHCNQTDEQLIIVSTKENFIDYIQKLYTNKNRKLTILELSESLSVTTTHINHLIHKYNAEAYIEFLGTVSDFENDIANYITDLIGDAEVQRSVRYILQNRELDIYLQNYNIAIEANGNYWHSDASKDKNYHLHKTLECKKLNISLIHIFEYEWCNDITNNKLKALLRGRLNINQTYVMARKTIIKEIDSKQAENFLNAYHLQDYSPAEISLGLFYNTELICVMTFGKSRFNPNYEWELIRLCTKHDYKVQGGANKLYKFFIRKYNPKSIISYCDLAKFSGKVYEQLGMTFLRRSKPSYIYINLSTRDIKSRYQCMKQLLIDKGYGTELQTEEQIMKTLGYNRIYDCGNAVYVQNFIKGE